jgi:hypothetical protein
MDVTHAERRELALPREVGGAVMDVLEHQGILTCHGFAHRLTLAPEENAKRGNTAMDMVTPGYETTTLATGERGLVGDPHHPVTDYTNGKIISVPGEALHSVVGLGPDSSEVIELPDFSARPSITSTDALLTAYQQRTGSKDTTLHRVAPPAPPITVDPVQYAMNPFGER